MRFELFNYICELNTYQNQSIKIIFTNKTENIFTDGFELTESYNCGYLKCIKLIIKLLSCQSEEKENVFKEINSVDLSYYYNYSCKSCFVKGFKQAMKDVENQIEKLKNNVSYVSINTDITY